MLLLLSSKNAFSILSVTFSLLDRGAGHVSREFIDLFEALAADESLYGRVWPASGASATCSTAAASAVTVSGWSSDLDLTAAHGHHAHFTVTGIERREVR